MVGFKFLEVVDRGSETQFLVAENLNFFAQCLIRVNIFHKKGCNCCNLAANIIIYFLYKISSPSADLSVNSLEKNNWCPVINNCSGYGLKCPNYFHQIMHQKQ